jgi:cobaltochelatase CobS
MTIMADAADRIGWMPYRNPETHHNDFLKVIILDEGRDYRLLQIVGGARDGEQVALPGAGIPFQGFHPSLYEQKNKPEVFWYKGRSLQKVDIKQFKNPTIAKDLIPEEEPYEFPPHTMEIIDGILAADHQMLSGKKGAGKTSILLQIAARIGMPCIRINFTGHTSISDIVGSVGFAKDGTVFKYGPVIRAMMEGYWCIADEFDFGEPRVLSVFHSILERHPSYCLKENDGEIIVAKETFRFFGTSNTIVAGSGTKYVGTNKMNIALLDRFSGHGRIIHVKPMTAKQEKKVIYARMPNLPKGLVRRVTEFAAEVRADESKLPHFSTRELLNWCHKIVEYKDAVLAANLTFLPIVEEGLRVGIEKVIQVKLGKRIIVGRAILPSNVKEAASLLQKETATVEIPKKVKAMIAASPAVVGDAKKTPTGKGRTASQVTDPEEMEKIWRLYKGNGGPYSHEQIENDTSLNLRQVNGMTAHRICKKYNELLAKSENKPLPKEDDNNIVAGE